ncbi:14894_t:CDS:2 [Funneliformis mosseae]|uniref:Phospholipid scramblase n=1 Tax=Funneliformis mosseae TaxID=27381 RepID=A0A9N9AX32_FUNMO|nr:14894_t:CDS:2 [Funneliformis mosseae]
MSKKFESRINRININNLIERNTKRSEGKDVPDTKVQEVIQQPFEVLNRYYPAAQILQNPTLVVARQLEILNIFLGFEQANKYALLDPNGNCVGYVAEEESFASTILRQLFRTHRKFNAMIIDLEGQLILKIRRPFAWINSRIFISTSEEHLIGEFARIDTGFLSWDFNIEDELGSILGSVNRNFSGIARELFTDTGKYVIRMDSRELTFDQRAVILAAAISIDFDYFSRHSGNGGFLPIPFIGGSDDTDYEID